MRWSLKNSHRLSYSVQILPVHETPSAEEVRVAASVKRKCKDAIYKTEAESNKTEAESNKTEVEIKTADRNECLLSG